VPQPEPESPSYFLIAALEGVAVQNMTVHRAVQLIEQETGCKVKRAVEGVDVQLVDVVTVGRHHAAVKRRLRTALAAALHARPAVASLHKVGRGLTLVLVQLGARDIGSQPVNPGKTTGYRISVLVFQNQSKRYRSLGCLLNLEGQRVR